MALEARRTSLVMIQPAVRYALWCAAFLLSLSATRATPGTIAGAVRHATEHTAISNAVVWAEPVGTTPVFPAPAQPAEMAQVHLAFVPRVLPVLAGTTVAFPNRATVYHSVFSLTRHQRFEIGLYPPGESRPVTLDKPGLVKVFCSIHDQMFGAILVLPTPYFSTSTAQGTFTLSHVPTGDYTVQVWHERLHGDSQLVRVADQGTTTLPLILRPKRRDG